MINLFFIFSVCLSIRIPAVPVFQEHNCQCYLNISYLLLPPPPLCDEEDDELPDDDEPELLLPPL